MPALYIARCLAHSGGLSSQRLCSSAAEPLVHFQRTAQTNGCAVTLRYKKKKTAVLEKKEFPLASLIRRSTRSVSQGIEVTLGTEYEVTFSN